MDEVFRSVNAFITPISDLFWEFPTNFAAYARIPVLGQFPFAVLLLVGAGIYFSFRTRFVQLTNMRKIVRCARGLPAPASAR